MYPSSDKWNVGQLQTKQSRGYIEYYNHDCIYNDNGRKTISIHVLSNTSTGWSQGILFSQEISQNWLQSLIRNCLIIHSNDVLYSNDYSLTIQNKFIFQKIAIHFIVHSFDKCNFSISLFTPLKSICIDDRAYTFACLFARCFVLHIILNFDCQY